MSNDHNGLVDDPWNGQPRESEEIEKRVSEEDGQSDNPSDGGILSNERIGIEKREAEEIVAALSKIGVSSSWSGLLPRPEDFNNYSKEVQDKMVAWNDAQILKESERSDRLVSAEI